MTGGVNMNSNSLTGMPALTNKSDAILKLYMENIIHSQLYNKFSETLIQEYYTTYAECIYKINSGLTSEVLYDSSSRKVSYMLIH